MHYLMLLPEFFLKKQNYELEHDLSIAATVFRYKNQFQRKKIRLQHRKKTV